MFTINGWKFYPLKSVNRGKTDFATKQRMLGLLTIKGPNNNSDTEIGRLLVIVWRLFHAILQFKGFCRQIVPLDLLIKVFF